MTYVCDTKYNPPQEAAGRDASWRDDGAGDGHDDGPWRRAHGHGAGDAPWAAGRHDAGRLPPPPLSAIQRQTGG